jgi:hypothetical protein
MENQSRDDKPFSGSVRDNYFDGSIQDYYIEQKYRVIYRNIGADDLDQGTFF